MQQKKAAQTLRGNHASQISGLYILDDYITCSESVITATNAKEDSRIILKLYTWINTILRLNVIMILRIVSWLSRLGGDEIDMKVVEASHKYHLGSRIHFMGH